MQARGQSGNKWESEDGKNLLISIILYPSIIISCRTVSIFQWQFPLVFVILLSRYISGCTIKWPNDIYVNNDKIAGILIENSIMGDKIENTIAGIGLNINQNKFSSDAPNPVSLELITGTEL